MGLAIHDSLRLSPWRSFNRYLSAPQPSQLFTDSHSHSPVETLYERCTNRGRASQIQRERFYSSRLRNVALAQSTVRSVRAIYLASSLRFVEFLNSVFQFWVFPRDNTLSQTYFPREPSPGIACVADASFPSGGTSALLSTPLCHFGMATHVVGRGQFVGGYAGKCAQ